MQLTPPPAEAYAVFAQDRTTLMGQQLASPWAPLGLMPDTTLRKGRFAKDVARLLAAAPAFGKPQPINSTRAAARPRVDIALIPLSELQYSASLNTLAFMLDHVYLPDLEALFWAEERNLQHKGASIYSTIYKPPHMVDFMFAFTDLKAVTTKFAEAKRDLADSPDNLLAVYNNLTGLQDTPLAYYALSDFVGGDVAWRPLHVARHGSNLEKIVGIPLDSSAALSLTDIPDKLAAAPASVFAALATSPEAQIISPYAFPVPCWLVDLSALQPTAPATGNTQNSATATADNATPATTTQTQAPQAPATKPVITTSSGAQSAAHPHRPMSVMKSLLAGRLPSGSNPHELKAVLKHLKRISKPS